MRSTAIPTTLVSGSGSANNISFIIDGSNLKTATAFDYETKSSYSIRIQTKNAAGLTYRGTSYESITVNGTSVSARVLRHAITAGSSTFFTTT